MADRRREPLLADDRGATMLEYLILIGVVVLLSLPAFTDFGGTVARTMRDQMVDPAKMGL